MTSTTRIEAVHVVVPVRNEEALLPACLESLADAVARLTIERPDIATSVCVVLDGCTDRSESVVRRHPPVRALSIDARSAGTARRHGVADVARLTPRHARRSTWVANTDADTLVPSQWLTTQVELAESGHELVVGTVEPDAADLDPEVLADWWSRHTLNESHQHVHGANLGFTLRAYLAVGGYPAQAEHEDVVLVRALREAGVRWCATNTLRVRTSGRETGRTPGGFAQYLRDLAVSARLGHPTRVVET